MNIFIKIITFSVIMAIVIYALDTFIFKFSFSKLFYLIIYVVTAILFVLWEKYYKKSITKKVFF